MPISAGPFNGRIPGDVRPDKTGGAAAGVGIAEAHDPTSHGMSPLSFDLRFLHLIPAEELLKILGVP